MQSVRHYGNLSARMPAPTCIRCEDFLKANSCVLYIESLLPAAIPTGAPQRETITGGEGEGLMPVLQCQMKPSSARTRVYV